MQKHLSTCQDIQQKHVESHQIATSSKPKRPTNSSTQCKWHFPSNHRALHRLIGGLQGPPERAYEGDLILFYMVSWRFNDIRMIHASLYDIAI